MLSFVFPLRTLNWLITPILKFSAVNKWRVKVDRQLFDSIKAWKLLPPQMSNLKCQVCSFIAIGQIFTCKYSPGLNALSDKTILTSALQNMYRNVNPYLTADSANTNEFAIENYRRAYCLSVATPSPDTVKSMLVDAYYSK